MSDQYYDNEVLNTSVLVEGVVWQQLEAGQSDTFLSVEDSCNETQYLSILETCDNNTILNDISGIGVLGEYDEPGLVTGPDGYQIDGSNDILAFDFAQDDEGNLQRFQYRLRLNDEGEYESVPGSIEIVPFDEEKINGLEESDTSKECSVKKEFEQAAIESNDVDEDSNGLHVNEDAFDEAKFVNGTTNCYPSHKRAKLDNLKKHPPLPSNQAIHRTHCKEDDATSFKTFEESLHNFSNSNTLSKVDLSVCGIEPPTAQSNEGIFEQHHIFLTEQQLPAALGNHFVGNKNNSIKSEILNHEHTEDSTSDAEEFEIGNGFHVTGDSEDTNVTTTLQQEEKLLPTVVLQIPNKKIVNNLKITYSNKSKKENATTQTSQIHLVKTNPRSVLKSSYMVMDQQKIKNEHTPTKAEKRVIQGRDFMPARLFGNYIAQTKILHAPVRQERLPRKQTIKPVDRTDEEIVVQEVVISSKGFVETSEDGVIKSKIPLKATEIVHLSDSDEDYRPKKSKVKKKSKPRNVEIVISDDDSDEPIIIEDSNDNNDIPVKKRRGRPPKCVPDQNKRVSVLPTKMSKLNSTETYPFRTRWKCQNCPKSFPSQGSLTSHMQSHTFQQPAAKYICSHCEEAFKNNVLLSRHLKTHYSITCPICNKRLMNKTELQTHKRIHIKSAMIKATDIAKCSPKTKTKLPVKHQHLCQFCPQTFSTSDLLHAHEKRHMQFPCRNCSLRFASKLMLESHTRQKCVKSKNHTSHIPHITNGSLASVGFKKPESSTTLQALTCDSCSSKFNSYSALYKHKVLVHNCETPDRKNILEETVSSKMLTKSVHSSVPANKQLSSVYETLQNKLNFGE